MNNMVSIIIPTYDRPTFLERAIKCALAQTYNDIEVIVVSDNTPGTDADNQTVQIVSQYADVPRFKYLEAIGNHGSCFARNRGLRNAKGDYINFLDDDDIILPKKIQRQMELALSWDGPLAVIGCQANIRNSQGTVYRIETPKYDPDNVFYSELKSNISTTTLNLINARLCLKVGGWEQIDASQEHLLLIKLFNELPTFAYVPEVLAEIDQHDGPRVSNNKKKPNGTLKLSEIIRNEYVVKLPPTLQKKVLSARDSLDTQAYFQRGDRRIAWNRFLWRLVKKPLQIENLRIARTAFASLNSRRGKKCH